MRKEIEVKAKITDTTALLAKLSALGVALSEPLKQEDAIYTNFPDEEFADFKPGVNFLRIRKSNGKVLFTLKQSLVNELEGIEKELEVSSEKEMEDILSLLGYHKAVQVIKTRRKANYKDYEICLDEVETLGSFIEVEKLTDEDSEKVQNEMFDLLIILGIEKADRVMNGYDTMVYLKQKSS